METSKAASSAVPKAADTSANSILDGLPASPAGMNLSPPRDTPTAGRKRAASSTGAAMATTPSASANNTPDVPADRKRPSATSRFLSKEGSKLFGSAGGTVQRKRSGSLLGQQNAGTPPAKPRRAGSMMPVPLLDADYDYDFKGAFKSPEFPRRELPPLDGDRKKNSSPFTKRKELAAPNPFIADKSSQWAKAERLEDWVAQIDTSQVKPRENRVESEEEEPSGTSNEDDSDSDDNSDDDDDDSDDSDDSIDGSEASSKDSRARFLEDEEEVFSSSESLSGSRLSKSHLPIPTDALRQRAMRELEVLASLVPARLLYAHASGMRPRGQLRAMREEFDGAVLFADISGFSRLAELLVRRQNPSIAAESLTKYVGWNLHEMVEVICSKGGDVMKFAGDAILAVFAADQFDGDLSRAAVCCAQAALSLQSLQLSAGDAKLSVHSGMGVGRVATYEVGGLQDRWEIFVAGPPVEQIGRCEPQAKAGELVVSAEARRCIEKLTRIRGAMVEDGNFRLDKILDPIEFKNRPSAAKEISNLAREDPDRAVELKRILHKYLSRPVIFSIESHGQTLWGAELRVCSTLFVKFKGLRFIEPSEEDLALVQYVVKYVVQKVMAELEGTVCRFMVDDKGAAMLLAFGLIPFSHRDDSARAVKAALMIRDGVAALSLAKPSIDLQKPKPAVKRTQEGSAGTEQAPLATTLTSAGVKGASSKHLEGHQSPSDSSVTASPGRPISRKRSASKYKFSEENTVRTVLEREYAPIPKALVSCQIGITRGKVCVGMVGGSTRCEYTLHGVLVNRAARLMGSATDAVVLCDQDTYNEAKNEVEFDSSPVSLKLKGERKEVKVYRPVRKATQRRGARSTGDSNKPDEEDYETGLVGRQRERKEIDDIYKKLMAEDPWCGVIGVQGDSGIGKTRLLQYVASVAKKNKSTVLSGFALDTEASTPFYIWKSIVVQIIEITAESRSSNNSAAAVAAAAAATSHVLHSVSSKETMTSFGSAHSFSSVNFVASTPTKRKNRAGSTRGPLSPPLGPQSALAEAGSSYRLGSPKNSSSGAPKKFEDLSFEEKKDLMIEALPLEKRELYPLLAPFVDEVIPSTFLTDNATTATIVRNQRVTVAIEAVVSMISYLATKLQQKGERLTIILDDVQWMDAPSLDLLVQVTKNVPRHAIFCSGSFSDTEELGLRVPCTAMWHLQRLERHEIARCMQRWLNVTKVADTVVDTIYERSNGNPLFSEELCRLMREQKLLEAANDDMCILKNAADTRMQLPNSIIALMTASLDRLDASQQIVLRVVSVMGMQFTLYDLAGVLKALNQMSTVKLFGGGDLRDVAYNHNNGEEEKPSTSASSKPVMGNIRFDIDQEVTLEQILKEQAPGSTGNSGATNNTPSNSSLGQQQARTTNASLSSVVSASTPDHHTGKAAGGGDGLSTSLSSIESRSSTSAHTHSAEKSNGGKISAASSAEDLDQLGKPPQEDFPTIKVNVVQVLNSLVQKGILEERSHGARRAFAFRHVMMKETAAEELLREEPKQMLHEIIGNYYEAHPGTDLAQWHSTLAEHFFAAKNNVKARKYLELAGEGALQNHATQQIYSCFSRLLKVTTRMEVSEFKRAQWCRKVGEALFHMDRFIPAEEYLHKALETLRLDCRDAPAISGTEAGFFPDARNSSMMLMCFRAPKKKKFWELMDEEIIKNGITDEDIERQEKQPPLRPDEEGAAEEDVVFRSRPKGMKAFLLTQCFNQNLDDEEYAEEFERFMVKTEMDEEPLTPTTTTTNAHHPGGSTLSSTSFFSLKQSPRPTTPSRHLFGTNSPKNNNGSTLRMAQRSGSNSQLLKANVVGGPQGGGGGNASGGMTQSANGSSLSGGGIVGGIGGGSNSVTGGTVQRTRTISMVEPQSPLRPRLLIGLRYFRILRQRIAAGTDTMRTATVEIFLECATVYDLLGRMVRDRSSSVALERRLNAIMLAEAAALSFSADHWLIGKKDARGGLFPLRNPRPGNTQMKGSSGASSAAAENAAASALLFSATGGDMGAQFAGGASSPMLQQQREQLILMSQTQIAAAAGGSVTSMSTPPSSSHISPQQQRILDELSRAYSRAAVFFAGMHPGTRWRALHKSYAIKANNFLRTHGQVSRTDLAQHSENLVLLQQRCGEYDAIQGNFYDASEKLRYAVWGARFMHLDRVRIDSKMLELTVFFFNGDMDSCNTTACELFEKNTSSVNVALGARFMALCGVNDVAVFKLRALAKLHGSLTQDSNDLSSFEKGLDVLNDVNAWLALSLVAWRGTERNTRLAIRAAIKAAEIVLRTEMSDAPLPAFHTAALCFTALWDPIRGDAEESSGLTADALGDDGGAAGGGDHDDVVAALMNGNVLQQQQGGGIALSNGDAQQQQQPQQQAATGGGATQQVPQQQQQPSSPQQPIPPWCAIEDIRDMQVVEQLLKRLVAIIRSFAVVYKVCRPHALYCVALRSKILAKMDSDYQRRLAFLSANTPPSVPLSMTPPSTILNHPTETAPPSIPSSTATSISTVLTATPTAIGTQNTAPPSIDSPQQPQPMSTRLPTVPTRHEDDNINGSNLRAGLLPPPVDSRRGDGGEKSQRKKKSSLLGSCFGVSKSSGGGIGDGDATNEEDPFAECAREANLAMCYWVEGLARLEMNDINAWWDARDIFAQYSHAEYELLRCEQKLAGAGVIIPEDDDGELNSGDAGVAGGGVGGNVGGGGGSNSDWQ